jgi:hypothetical protein
LNHNVFTPKGCPVSLPNRPSSIGHDIALILFHVYIDSVSPLCPPSPLIAQSYRPYLLLPIPPAHYTLHTRPTNPTHSPPTIPPKLPPPCRVSLMSSQWNTPTDQSFVRSAPPPTRMLPIDQHVRRMRRRCVEYLVMSVFGAPWGAGTGIRTHSMQHSDTASYTIISMIPLHYGGPPL